MHEKHLYEYAIIRVLPRVEREEFVNVGVIMFCKREKYIKMRYQINESRLLALSDAIDLDQMRENLQAFESITNGDKNCGAIARLDVPERFRWLTAVRSTCLQTSRPHSGFSDNLDATLDKLFEEQVL